MSMLFLPSDIVRNIGLSLPDQGIYNALQVCKQWNEDLEANEFWGSLIPKRGLPLVEDIYTGHKTVYRNLFRRTMSGEMFKKYYGEVRDIPLLAKKVYEKFINAMDPFNITQKKMCQTFWLMIDPSHVYRPYEEKLFNFLNASLNPEDTPEILEESKEMKVPFTLTNRIRMIEYLHPDKKVFGSIHPQVLVQCNSAPKKTALWLMREDVVFMGETDCNQKQWVKDQGFERARLATRLAFNALKICDQDACPDKGTPYHLFATTEEPTRVSARTPDMVGGESSAFPVPVAIGGYVSGEGVNIFCSYLASPGTGVAPGLRAEV